MTMGTFIDTQYNDKLMFNTLLIGKGVGFNIKKIIEIFEDLPLASDP